MQLIQSAATGSLHLSHFRLRIFLLEARNCESVLWDEGEVLDTVLLRGLWESLDLELGLKKRTQMNECFERFLGYLMLTHIV